MSKSVAVIGLIVFLAAVIAILWAVVRNMPIMGVIAGCVIAALGLGWASQHSEDDGTETAADNARQPLRQGSRAELSG